MQKLALLSYILALVIIPTRLASRSPSAGPSRVAGWMLGVTVGYYFVIRFVAFRFFV